MEQLFYDNKYEYVVSDLHQRLALGMIKMLTWRYHYIKR